MFRVFMMFYNYLPSIIDSIDNDITNSRIENLRAATKSQDCANKGLMITNKTGYKGVSYIKKYQKFYASIRYQGKSMNLGKYNSAEEAYQIYCKKAKELFGEFANFG